MKTIHEWLDEYAVSHQNPTNKLIHYICVPLIMISVLGLFWSIPVHGLLPAAALPSQAGESISLLNVATVFMVGALLFYIQLSPMLALGMVFEAAAMIAFVYWLDYANFAPVWLLSILIFVVSWIFQFIGHNIEGKKPSFFKDVQFLLIGPIWILGYVYRQLGIRY
jgi:uncharacterized membrane protein YGL010W